MAVKRLGELTVEELKKELRKRELNLNGDRNELMARLKKALSEEKKSGAANSSQREKKPAAAASAAVDQSATRDVPAENLNPAPEAELPTECAAEPEPSHREEQFAEPAEFDSGVVAEFDKFTSELERDRMMIHKEEKEEEEEAKKVVDDPPLDLMVDESQNDLDDDIVCVSVTPGKGFPIRPVGQVSKSDGKRNEEKAGTGAERPTPNQGSNEASGDGKTAEQGDSKDLSIWVSGLSSSCRAADLKAKFNQCGKVTGAKVVASAKAPASKCFGIVTMSSHSEVQRCLKELNGTDLNGQPIVLELYSGRRVSTTTKAAATPATPTLWVTGIGPSTKAADLKKLFVAHGKVVAATIVMNPASGGSRRGLIKMASCEEADICIEKLNKITFAGRTIEVERSKSNVVQPAKSPAAAAAGNAPPLMKQKSNLTEASKSRASSFLGSTTSSARNVPRDRPNRLRDNRPRRGFGGGGGRGGERKGGMGMTNRADFERRRQMLIIQQERERDLKVKQAELVRAFQIECDRRKQKEEAERIAYEREQLEIERMKLERERIESERLKLQLEQERRRHEREQLERSRNEMYHDESRMPPKRSMDQEDVYWDYLVKKRRDSSPSSSMQNLDSGHGSSYENATARLQQLASYSDGRPGDNRMKQSIPGGSGVGSGNRSSGGSMYHPASANNSADSGKSEWKSLYNMSSVGGGGNSQTQWKSPSSSLGGGGAGLNGRQFGSMSSYRDRPYSENASSGFPSGGFKGGFGAGRGGGGNKWR